MAILSYKIETTGLSGQVPRVIYITTNDTYDKVIVPGYLQSIYQENAPLVPGFMALVSVSNPNPTPGSSSVYTEFMKVQQIGGLWSLVPAASSDTGATVKTVVFRVSGQSIYTKPAGLKSALIQIVGGGGAGGGATGVAPNQCGQGGGAGGYSQKVFQASEIPDIMPVIVGAGGVPVPGAKGGDGGLTQVGQLLVASGGEGGANSIGGVGEGAPGFGGGYGDIDTQGGVGKIGTKIDVGAPLGTIFYSGEGGASFFGGGGLPRYFNSSSQDDDGLPALSYGAGGGGALGIASVKEGGTGGVGVVMVTEYF